MLNEAEPIARKFGKHFCLVRILGCIALISEDMDGREKVLVEAERLLDEGVVAHNHFAFYVDITESAFNHSEWDRLENAADRMQAYTRFEPLPFSDFVVDRARVLAAFGRGNRSAENLDQLNLLRDRAKEACLLSSIVQIDAALSSHLKEQV